MKMLLDSNTAVVDQEAFDALLEYSSSIPTGTTIGKRWKRRVLGGTWRLGEYAVDSDPNYVKIIWRNLEVV